MTLQVDSDKILSAIRRSIPLTIKTYTLPHETEVYLEEVLAIFLKELGRDNIKDKLAYCLRELAVNAKKANTKRVYFLEKELSLDNPADYEAGMAGFKEDTLSNIKHYLELQKKKGLYVKVVFHTKGRVLSLSVRNNVEITQKELMRVYDRIARSRAYESVEDAFNAVLDSSEGAGLGIVILILMLRKIGLDDDAFDIDVVNGETIARIIIPMDRLHVESIDMLSEEIVEKIDALPQFPENIVYLQSLINNPDSEITDIARQIATDPSLTADLLKVVNSAQFMLSKKVDNIVDAVKLVGLRGLRNILYSYGTQKLLEDGNGPEDQKELWRHSYRTAFYAYNLAKSFKHKKDMLDDAYVGGILHDMGKIVFSSAHPKLLNQIQHFCTDKEIPKSIIEKLTTGLNHAAIGAKIAQKWNFPAPLIAAIQYHHEPLAAPEEYQDVVFTVYLANSICEIEGETLLFEQIDPVVLKDFGITSEEQLQHIVQKLSAAFQKELEGRL